LKQTMKPSFQNHHQRNHT